MAKSKMKRIIHAGLLVVEAVYPRRDKRDSERARAAKSRASSEAQKRMNRIYSYQKLELLLAANFRPGDLWVTVTYDNDHLPKDRKEARADFKYFLDKLRRARKRRGAETVMIYNTEHKHEHQSEWEHRRWHHHFVLNTTGKDDFDELRRCWLYGSNIEIRFLRLDGENSFEALARYLCKEQPDKLGQHCWGATRNIKKPEVESFRVEADTTVQAPKGSRVLLDEGGHDPYCAWRVVKYLEPGWDKAPKPRRRRKR